MPSASIIIVPGWRDSGPGHWQTLWAESLPCTQRVVQDDWVAPTRQAWVGALSQLILLAPADPYCPVRTAGAYARAWGSQFVRLQDAGHINIEAGFGRWPLGLALLQSLAGGP